MKLDRIVVGVDFSAPSVEAAQWVASIVPGAEIVLAHAIAIPEPTVVSRGRPSRHELLVETLRAGADKRLREISLSVASDRVWLETREGDPVACLTRIADEYGADLIVAGAQGERRGVREGLGSTAEHLVRASRHPVLLVVGPHLTAPAHILVPVAHVDDAAHSLKSAAVMQRLGDARLTTLHIVTSGVASGVLAAAAVLSGTPPFEVGVKAVDEAERDKWLKCALNAGVPLARITSEVAFGEATQEILNAVTRLNADLIVMGRRASGDLRRTVLGSVVNGVLRHAPCPVLVVPEPPVNS